MNSALNQMDAQLDEIIVQPFPIHFDCNDYHVIVYIENHPEYEAVEAMIKEYREDSAFIRAILTRHDKSQTDYINDSLVVEKLKNKRRKREVYFAPVQYERYEKRGKPRIVLKFTSFKGEEVVLDFHAAAKATDRHAGLIDPCGHSSNISLPVMFPVRTALASPKSSVMIDGIKYKLPVQVHIPLLFKGMRGYYSELFNIGVFRAGNEHFKIIQTPQSLNPGEKWVYRQGAEEAAYEISAVEGSSIVIRGENETVEADITRGIFSIKRISVFSQSKGNINTRFTIEFTPSLPVLPEGENECESKGSFSISIDDHTSLISGTVRVMRENGVLRFLLAPSEPDWAVKRPVSMVIERQKSGFEVKTDILN